MSEIEPPIYWDDAWLTEWPAKMIDGALEIAASAWEILPCRPSGPQAKSPLTTHGHHDATMDPDQIKAWWTRWPDAMIGAAVPDNCIVIDVDPRNGGDPESLVAIVGDLPPTLTVWSGRNDGGRHLYYQRPAGTLTSTSLPQGIDLKVRGYCRVPPSVHPATNLPYWEERPVAEMPADLVELLTPAPHPGWSVPATVPTVGKLAGLLRKVAEAPDRNRNKILFWAGCRVAEANYPAEAWDALANAGRAAGLPDYEIRKAIRSAQKTGGAT